jgi:Flp pilus assembly protein TadD
VALLFAVTIDRLWNRRRHAAAWVLLAVVMSGNALRTVARDRDWHDELRLFARATRDAPHAARGWNNLGAALMQDGRPLDALDALNHAITLRRIGVRRAHSPASRWRI